MSAACLTGTLLHGAECITMANVVLHIAWKLIALQAGLIINIGSIAGEMGFAPVAVYATSKWALRGWSLSCYEVSRLPSSCL